MIKKTRSIPLILGLLMLTGILSACAGMFQPRTKTIEYDEQVKLHNGEMIWVHITRHYYRSSAALGDPEGMESVYRPTQVEISWDTGFPGVGRKSVFFDNLSMIDKFNGKWYLFGGIEKGYPDNVGNSINVSKIGNKVGSTAYLVIVDYDGSFLKNSENDLFLLEQTNILNPVGIRDWGYTPDPLNKQDISWKKKLKLQNQQPKNFQFIHNEFNAEKIK